MVTDYQYKDYRILASTLVGDPVLPIENMSSVSFKDSKGNNLNSVYEEKGSNKVNFHVAIPSLYSYFDLLNKKSDEDNQYGNLISFSSKLNTENEVDDFTSKAMNNSDMNCYDQNQCQDDILNESPPPDPTINFEELNRLAFTGRYPQ